MGELEELRRMDALDRLGGGLAAMCQVGFTDAEIYEAVAHALENAPGLVSYLEGPLDGFAPRGLRAVR